MRTYSLSHVQDDVLLRDLTALVAHERAATASILAHIAEVDARRLYVADGYPSMFAYCVDELHLSEDAAYRRIQAARAARQFPILFTALAEGRLHLTAVCLLAPHLTAQNVEELVGAATHRRKNEIESLIAGKCSHVRETSAIVNSLPVIATTYDRQLAPAQVGTERSEGSNEVVPASDEAPVEQVEAVASAERFLVQFTISKSMNDKLRYAQSLLRHAVPTGDVAQVLERALDVLIAKCENQKFGAAHRARLGGAARSERLANERMSARRGPNGRRYISAHVRRAVWERDGGQCTFVSARGRRCGSRDFLEFDHIQPVARGGAATVAGMRLRCRAHNQYEAERAFGVAFMRGKRDEAHAARARARARARIEAHASAEAKEREEVVAALRGLGCRVHEAHHAVEASEAIHGATLEERVRAALKVIGHRATRR